MEARSRTRSTPPWGHLHPSMWAKIFEDVIYDDEEDMTWLRTHTLQRIIKLASVCSAWREATRFILGHQFDGICSDKGEPVPSRMDSKLILDLIPGMVAKVMLFSPTYLAAPGMARFIASCTSLQEMHITAEDLLVCSQADACLASCRTLETLTCRGIFLPHFLPVSLTELEVDIRESSELGMGGDTPAKWTEALLFRVGSLPALDRLTLKLGDVPHLPAMPGLTWRRIGVLDVFFDLDHHTSFDLGWLRDQPADSVHLHVTMRTKFHYQHNQLVQALSSITMHSLSFDVQANIEPQSQLLWTSLTALSECYIYLSVPSMSLHSLPCCSVNIQLAWSGPSDGQYQLLWPALCAHPGRVRVGSFNRVRHVEVVGFLGFVPSHAEPWQLELGMPVPGIPAAFLRRCGDKSIMQNPAAHAAGWELDRS